MRPSPPNAAWPSLAAAGLIAMVAPAMLALVVPAPAAAQTPSAEEIIQSLRSGSSTGTRGIRELGPSSAAPASAPASTPAYSGTTAQPAPYAGPATSPGPASSASARVAAGRPAAASPAAVSPVRPSAPRSVNLTVNFPSGSAELAPGATHTLDELGRALTSSTLSGSHFRIEGHTDTVGTPEMNKSLSERRAAKVVEYLVAKWHIDRARVESAGMGQEHLLVPTGPNVPEAGNRRVTVINLGA